MDITLEMVERLKEKANISYGQAKEALEYSGGNLLDALIYLEEKGAIPREEGAYFSTKSEAPSPPPAPEPLPVQLPAGTKKQKAPKYPKQPHAGRAGTRRFFNTLRRWLVDNELEIWRKDQPITALPVLILVLLVFCAPWFTIPVLVLGLFLGFRYRFSGPDLDRDGLNSVIGSVADTAADLGHKVMEELKHDWHSDEK
ncbi:MAG: ubiquitin [Lawsonibacter sp.]|nr:ubiquitin [Lawsonibacter sp.]